MSAFMPRPLYRGLATLTQLCGVLRSLSDYAVAYDVQVVTPTGIRKRRTILLDRTNRVVYRVANVVRWGVRPAPLSLC